MTRTDGPNPVVSVVVPTYNRASLVPEAIDSVLAQDYPHWELLIVDDGSTDNTEEVLVRYDLDPRVRVFRQPNSGQAIARNVGVRNARGDWVAFLDSDNRWLPNKLDTQVEFLTRHPEVDVVYGDIEMIDLQGTVRPGGANMQRYSGVVWRQLLIDNFVNFNTSVVRRARLIEVGGFDQAVRRGDDYDLWLRLGPIARFQYLPGIVAQYRVEGDRISVDVDGRFESNVRAVEKFISTNPHLLSAREIRQVWSKIYSRFARAFAGQRQIARALGLAAQSVMSNPLWLGSWRTLLAVAVSRMRGN